MSGTEAPATVAASSSEVAAPVDKPPARGIEVVTGPDGSIEGVAIGPTVVLYGIVDRFVGSPRLITLPVQQRFALAGKVAAVPSEYARLVERLASSIATSISEVGALNALYFLEICRELVPNFKDAAPQERLAKAAELSPHGRVQAAILLGEKPKEWEQAEKQTEPGSLILFEPEEEDKGLIYDAGRAVGGATKLVGSAALGGVGLVTDTLGVTKNAEGALGEAAEDAVDIIGDGMNAVVDGLDDVVDSLDGGLQGTADDLRQKGLGGMVGDGLADTVDMVTDFMGDAVGGIASGVRGALDFLAGEGAREDGDASGAVQRHKAAIVVAELFGDERSLGLRLEDRVITKFTKPEAENLGWRLGDCIIAVGASLVNTQDEMLAAIAPAKEALKSSGTPIKFLIERPGSRPGGLKAGGSREAHVRASGRRA